jgi:tripartite ATP-independent transporter DctM subunit
MAAFIPGFVLSALYCGYIAVRCAIQKNLGPAVPPEEITISFGQKSKMLVVALAPTALIIFAVLGSIFLGIAPPTEAAAVGALASIGLAVGYRRFSWSVLKDTVTQSMQVSSMIYLIGALSFAYVGVFVGAGCGNVIKETIMAAPGGRWGGFAMIMFIVFLLGFFIDWIGIVFIMVPIVAPIAPALGFDPLWFGMMLVVNLQMSFMTPPFASAIFYLRGSADPALGVTMADIIKGVWPFVICIIIGLGLCVIFPQLILWLPGKMIA